MGNLVSGIDPYLTDATKGYSLIVPNIKLNSEVNAVEFETMVVVSFSDTFWGRPALPSVLTHNSFVPVSCVAQKVMF